MSRSIETSTNEIRWFLTGLLFVFIVGKLFGFIDWSWVWVFAPFWIPLALSVALMVLMSAIRLGFYLAMSKEQREQVKRVESANKALRAYEQTFTRR